MASEIVDLEGHLIDSLVLAKVLDIVVSSGAEYRVVTFDLGRSGRDPSQVTLEVTHPDAEQLDGLLAELTVHGANRRLEGDARLEPAPAAGVLPAGFYATTNLPTQVRLAGTWQAVPNPEMDCALVVTSGEDFSEVRTVPMHRVAAGAAVVCGDAGVRTEVTGATHSDRPFAFMTSAASSEKPQGHLVELVAERMRQARELGEKILVVPGPAVVHTGGSTHLARLVAAGFVDVVFTGNGFATHDLESSVFGTSLGVAVPTARGHRPHGHQAHRRGEGEHSNHLRLINEIRRRGSIAAAVAEGYVAGGVMHACVVAGVPYVLGGSLRDDGPLPDVITDVVEAADAMRGHVAGVGVCLMLASTLHAIATGNLLAAGVSTFCVDINPAVVTKLTDRGTHQAMGIVNDAGLFLERLARELCGEEGGR